MTSSNRTIPWMEMPGLVPIPARWETWQDDLCSQPELLADLVAEHGSPLHLHHPATLLRNAAAFQAVAQDAGGGLEIHFARKANKALCYVEAARDGGLGVDVAGHIELREALDTGVPGSRLVATPAAKDDPLLDLCVAHGVALTVDTRDDAARLAAVARRHGTPARIALRVSGFQHQGHRLPSRFGIAIEEAESTLRAWNADPEIGEALGVVGLHFHLGGYDGEQRVTALRACLELADALAAEGHRLDFLDMGGGFPMRYTEDEAAWRAFWRDLRSALRGEGPALTWRGHAFGLHSHQEDVVGDAATYPHFQAPVGADWLRSILTASADSSTGGKNLAQAVADRGLSLYCEPGRALLDGCGMTVARVSYRKPPHPGSDDPSWWIGLEMTADHCRSRKSELFTDPRLVRIATASDRTASDRAAFDAYLVGARCAEDDLISHRRLRAPGDLQVGDLVVFANTAGYLMHFVENRSHRFPLPANLVIEPGGLRLDPVNRL